MFLFVGYSEKQKVYICLSTSGKIIISRKVIFNEKHFPFQNSDNPFAVPISPSYIDSSITTPITLIEPTVDIACENETLPQNTTVINSPINEHSNLYENNNSSVCISPLPIENTDSHLSTG